MVHVKIKKMRKNELTVPHKPCVLRLTGDNQLTDNFTVDNW
jgi:hypothetical protein